MVDLGKGVEDFPTFSTAMDGELGEFEFPEDFVRDVWSAVLLSRQGQWEWQAAMIAVRLSPLNRGQACLWTPVLQNKCYILYIFLHFNT